MRFPEVAELWSECDDDARNDRIRMHGRRVAAFLGYSNDPIDSDSTRSWLNDSGRLAYKWATRASACLARNHPVAERDRVMLRVATHHLYESTALSSILPEFLATDIGKMANIVITQVTDVLQGINLL